MSRIKIRIANSNDLASWNANVNKNPKGTIFHNIDWLRITEKHSHSKFFPLVGYKGDALVFLFPIFLMRKFGINFVLSPPPGGSQYMGPLFFFPNEKQSGIESIMKQCIEKSIRFIEKNITSKINLFNINLISNVDVRPFTWNGFVAKPMYTYLIDTNRDSDQIWDSFSQTERRYLKKIRNNSDIDVMEGDFDDILTINELTNNRYKEQGRDYNISETYLRDIYSKFNDKLHVTVLKEGTITKTGIVFIESNKCLGHWIGATPTKPAINGATSLLHWQGIQKAKSLGLKRYDLFGANTEHLCINKSKLNPSLEIFFQLTKKDLLGRISQFAYKKIKGK